jgi:hypothetical protein
MNIAILILMTFVIINQFIIVGNQRTITDNHGTIVKMINKINKKTT